MSSLGTSALLSRPGSRVAARLTWQVDFRGKSRIVGWLPLKGTQIFSLPWARMRLDLGDRIQRGMAFGSYERREVAFVRNVLGSGGTAVDVGAHVGFYSLLFASLVGPGGRVLALEPRGASYDSLQGNIALNGFGWCEPLRVAASSLDGRSPLYSSAKSGESGWAGLDAADGWITCDEVEVVRLDHVLQSKGVHQVDLMKIDVEGHELSVLQGLRGFLDQTPVLPVLLVELAPSLQNRAGHDVSDVANWLRPYGYRIYRSRDWSGRWRPNAAFVPEALARSPRP